MMHKIITRVVLWAAIIVGTLAFLYFKVREFLPGKPVADPTKHEDEAVDGIATSDEEVSGKLEGASQSIEHMTQQEVISEFKKAFGVKPTDPNNTDGKLTG